jgi:tRNA-specific 2-thiouridylase
LCQLNQDQLSKAIFPIGELLKPQVREIAQRASLPSALKRDSQGICFVGKIDLPLFLQQKLEPKDGDVVEIYQEWYNSNDNYRLCVPGFDLVNEDNLCSMAKPYSYSSESGKIIGQHNGAHFYTIGQRRGLNIGGHKESLFIISTDITENVIYVGEGQSHPGLSRKALFIDSSEVHWIREDLAMKAGETRDFEVRIRYRQPLQSGKLFMKKEGLYIVFDQPQRGITPGQFAAWYSQGEMIGSGVILR